MDLGFNIKSSNLIFDNKIAYIHELRNGNIVVVDLNKIVKILEVKDEKLEIYKKIETLEERNFVVTELANKNIICGGYKYLSIIEPSFWSKYSLKKSIELNNFICNIVELDNNSYLLGLSHIHTIFIYSSINNEEIYRNNNINIKSNNYSICKISDDFIGIAGWEQSTISKACIFIISIKEKKVFKKLYMDADNFMVISKLNDKEFIAIGEGFDKDKHSHLVLFNYKINNNRIVVNKNCDFKRGHCDTIEAIITINNYIISSDSSSNLKLWCIE